MIGDDTGEETREGTLDMEKSAPSPKRKEGSTHRNGSSGVVNRVALREFMALVPRREVKGDSRCKTSFCNTKSKTHTGQSLP